MYSLKITVKFVFILVLSMLVFGCDNSKSDKTEVKLQVYRGSQSDSGARAPMIDPSVHPDVAVKIIVSAPEFDSPLVFTFSPAEIAANKGIIELSVPSGNARTFTPDIFEYAQSVSVNNFPGTRYIPSGSHASRTVDLIGNALTLDIDMTAATTASMSGIISDDRTGALAPLNVGCANPQVNFILKNLFISAKDYTVPVTVGGGGTYTLNNVPIGFAFDVNALDNTTGANRQYAIKVDAGPVFNQNFDLLGSVPLSLTPATVNVGSNQTQILIADGGIAPYSAWISQNNSGANVTPSSGIAKGGQITYTAGYNVTGLTDIVRLTDSCGAITTSTVSVVWGPIGVVPTPASITTEDQVGVQVLLNGSGPGDVLIEFISDGNQNGVVDTGELPIKMFQVTDGNSSAVYYKVPVDEDGTADNFITTTLPFYDPAHIAGDYIIRSTNLTTLTQGTAPFSITPVITKPVKIAGKVYLGSNPVAGIIVALGNPWDGYTPLEWSFTDALGNYEIYTDVTSNKAYLAVLGEGSVFDLFANPTVDLGGGSATIDLDVLSSDGTQLNSNVFDSASKGGPGAPIMGVLVYARTLNGRYHTIARSAANGGVSIKTKAESWLYYVQPISLQEKGYFADTKLRYGCASGITTEPDMYFPLANSSMSGSVTAPTKPITVIADDGTYISTTTVVAGSTGIDLPVMDRASYSVRVAERDLGRLNLLSPPTNVFTPGFASLTLSAGFYTISGTVVAMPGSIPVGGLPIDAVEAYAGTKLTTLTDSSGNYSIPANMGDYWTFRPRHFDLSQRNLAILADLSVFVNSVSVTGADFQTDGSTGSSLLSGRVRIQGTSTPLPFSTVTIEEYMGEGSTPVTSVLTDCNGNYSVRLLPSVSWYYLAWAERQDGYLPEWWQETDYMGANQIDIIPPTAVSGIDFTLEQNVTPSITSNAPTTATENTLYSYNINSTDPNSNDIIFLSTGPSDTCFGSVFDNYDGTGNYSFTPSEGTGGTSCVVAVQAMDLSGSSVEQTTTVNIAADNQPPVIGLTCPPSVPLSSPITCTLTVTDADVPANTVNCTLAVDDTCGGILTGCTGYNLATSSANCRVSINASDNGTPVQTSNAFADVLVF